MEYPDIPARVPPAPPRPAHAHKGTFGTVIVIGGSPTMIGAPALCATAAFRAGAGLVKLAVPTAIVPFAVGLEPSATAIAVGDDVDSALHAIHGADPDGKAVLAVGPGLGRSHRGDALVHRLLRGRRTMVLDADGLNVLADMKKVRSSRGPRLVVTPHPGEFARLAEALGISESPTDPQTRPAAAAVLAQLQSAVVVLKGAGTVVCDPTGRYCVNQTGNPALATAGSGDVLTGLIAGLMAQGMSTFEAAVLGVHLHGLAADLWAARFGPSGLTARDLANLIPEAFQQHRSRQ